MSKEAIKSVILLTSSFLPVLVSLAPSKLVNYHCQNLYKQPHGKAGIEAQVKRVAHELAQRVELKRDFKGWDCFSGDKFSPHFQQTHTELSQTQAGQDTLKSMSELNTKICIASDKVYDERYENSGGHYNYYYNTIFLKASQTDDAVIAHEQNHAVEHSVTNGRTSQLQRDGKLTSAMQAHLLLEAGSVSKEVIHAFQQKANNKPELYQKFYDEGSRGIRGNLVRTLNQLIKQDPRVGNYFKNPNGYPPHEVMDTLFCSFLMKGGIRPWLSNYMQTFAKKYVYKNLSELDFTPIALHNTDVGKLTCGTSYPENTPFPKTVLAINALGKNLRPLMERSFQTKMSGAEIEQMTETFVENLEQQPQRYQTARNKDKWAHSPKVTL